MRSHTPPGILAVLLGMALGSAAGCGTPDVPPPTVIDGTPQPRFRVRRCWTGEPGLADQLRTAPDLNTLEKLANEARRSDTLSAKTLNRCRRNANLRHRELLERSLAA